MTLSDFMRLTILTLNESPSEKEGKCNPHKRQSPRADTLNESPSEKEGKFSLRDFGCRRSGSPSMKVPPKRKGNVDFLDRESG